MAPKTWLITGCSSGIGEGFVYEIIKRGDKAIATVRGDVAHLAALKDAGAHVYYLDIIEAGPIDMLVNNAGYIEFVFVEELTDARWIAQFETNFFSTAKLCRAILPLFRSRRVGTVVLIGSKAGWAGMPGVEAYCCSKFALEGMSATNFIIASLFGKMCLHETLRAEMAPFGIRSLIFELGIFRTRVFHESNLKLTPQDAQLEHMNEFRHGFHGFVEYQRPVNEGDPQKAIKIMVDVVKGEGVAVGMGDVDRLPIGNDAVELMTVYCEKVLEGVNKWKNVVSDTGFD